MVVRGTVAGLGQRRCGLVTLVDSMRMALLLQVKGLRRAIHWMQQSFGRWRLCGDTRRRPSSSIPRQGGGCQGAFRSTVGLAELVGTSGLGHAAGRLEAGLAALLPPSVVAGGEHRHSD